MLRQSDGYLSGQQLCDHFQVSRTAVWKAINQLKEEGYEIEAVRNKGYRIVDIPDRIQLRAWKIYGNGCIRYLGCDGDRLGIPGNVFRDPVFQRKLEEKCDCIG